MLGRNSEFNKEMSNGIFIDMSLKNQASSDKQVYNRKNMLIGKRFI